MKVAPVDPSVSVTTGEMGAASSSSGSGLPAPVPVAVKVEVKEEQSPSPEHATDDPYFGPEHVDESQSPLIQENKVYCHNSIDGSERCPYAPDGKCFECQHVFCSTHYESCSVCAEVVCIHCGINHACIKRELVSPPPFEWRAGDVKSEMHF